MSGLREALDEIAADAPVYGDLDRAIEQADRERRRRYGVIAGVVAAAAVLVVIAGMVAISRDRDTAPPVSPAPTPSPTSVTSQSPRTWADTPLTASEVDAGWHVPDPLEAARDVWFPVVAEHLDPTGDLESIESDPWGVRSSSPPVAGRTCVYLHDGVACHEEGHP